MAKVIEKFSWGIEGRAYTYDIEAGIVESELKFNPCVQNIKAIVDDIFNIKDLEFESHEKMRDFVKEAVLEYGLNYSKNLPNELNELYKEIKPAVRFYRDFDQGYLQAVKKTLYKFYLSAYQRISSMLKKTEETERKKIENTKTVGKFLEVKEDTKKTLTDAEVRSIVEDATVKSEAMRYLYQNGLTASEIRIAFDCKYSQVRSAIKPLL